MKLGFFMVFFLLFNSYLMLMAIVYLNTERLWLWVKRYVIRYQIFMLQRRIKRIERKQKLSFRDRQYFKRSLRKADRLWAFHLAEEKSSPKTKKLFEEVYTQGLQKRFRKVLRLEPAAQYMLINRIPQIGFMNNDIKTSLLRSLNIDDHDIRMLTLYVIISLKSKNYFIEAMIYISQHHLGYNTNMLSFLLLRAKSIIPDLSITDLIEERKHFSKQVRMALIMAIGKLPTLERVRLRHLLQAWFVEEKNHEVRPYFYNVLMTTEEYDSQQAVCVRDLHSAYEKLRLAVLRYQNMEWTAETLDFIEEDLISQRNINIIFEEVTLLQRYRHHKREYYEEQPLQNARQVLRSFDYVMGKKEGQDEYMD